MQVVSATGTGRRTVGRVQSERVPLVWLSGRELFLTELEYDLEEGPQLVASVLDVESGARRRVGASPRVGCAARGHRRGWVVLSCGDEGRAERRHLKLLELSTGREVDLPWPARPPHGTVSDYDVRLTS